ncbi:molecular chaperone DnaJ [Buchnera aphidicola (Thelaxes californica)]|uniref:Chaperone protein DnaJ n=1 Tax=Buchnera aphidicola (Thelaxes californica) TaxID=1315998 RepID=A0A4D6YF36_9GAMM|nr:molecular chaperone DnaJ [Buchnera aphidicola]QCI26673.1 molecular chaperone DnaJ [Buchnera aphidicola (Thelaxes californica)]
MEKKDYYQTLGVSKSANEKDIKRAYKRLAMKYHPDRNQGDKQSEIKFKEIKEAYEILTDEQKRSAYDQYGHAAFEQGNNTNDSFTSSFSTTTDFGDIFGDVFGDIFGNNSNTQRHSRGADLQYNMELSLEEAVKGTIKEIIIPSFQRCTSCTGSGTNTNTKPKKCTSCKGSGQIHIRRGFFSVQQSCHHCQGKGIIIKNPCNICYGKGRIKKNKKLSIKIPSGVDNNDKIRLHNEGEVGEYNSPSGDLFIKFRIRSHPIFQREENHLYCEVPINFTIAALGGNIEVPTLDGRLKIKVPPETQSGKIFRIRGKGIKSIRNKYHGDLMCKVVVETPVNLNEHQKNLLSQLGNSFNGLKGDNNSPKTKRFFDRVKQFFDNLTL